MSQHDYSLANQAGAGFRSDANDALAAIVSNNSGASAPATTFAYMLWADTTNGVLKQRNAANSGWITVLTLGQVVDKFCEGRLTLTSGTPVTTSDVTAAETIYFTPYKGNKISLYNGTDWKNFTFSELSLDVPDVTGMHDVFAYDNSGTVALEALVWTNTTTRATALTLQDGIYVKNGATGRRYLGSFYSTTAGNGQTEDSLANRLLWNFYNRAPRQLQKLDTSAAWTYSTASWRSMNNNTANRVTVVIGVQDAQVVVRNVGGCNLTGGTAYIGIGYDSTSDSTAEIDGLFEQAGRMQAEAVISGYPGIGLHYYQAMELGSVSGSDFLGVYGQVPGHGLFGTIHC